jgi:tetratricopeptide (TPR) repeat protein
MADTSRYDDDSPRGAKTAASSSATDAATTHALERRAQWLAIGLALMTLVVVVLAVAFLLYYSQAQKAAQSEATRRAAEADREVAAALTDAQNRSESAKLQTEHPLECEATLVSAEDALKRAEATVNISGAKEEQKEKVKKLRGELEATRKALDLAKQLDGFRLRRPDGSQQAAGLAKEYAKAFEHFGLDVRVLEAPLSAKRLQTLPARDALLDGVLDWASITPDKKERAKLLEVVTLALADSDPNSVHRRVADALLKDNRKALIDMAGEGVESKPPRSIRRLGDALLQAGADAEAQKVLRSGQQLWPKDFWLSYTLGAVLVQRPGARDRSDALRFLTAAASTAPDWLWGSSASLYNNLGQALKNNGEIDDALKAYGKAKTIDGQNIAVLNNLGFAYQLQGQVDNALEVLEYAKTIDPKRLETQINLGSAYRAKGDLNLAIACFKEALEINGKSATAHTNLGLALEARGDLVGAIAEHQIALGIEPKSVQAHNNLGNAQLAKGDVDEALHTFQAALEIDPQYPATHINLGNALRMKGDFDGAIRSFQTAAELNPRDALPHEHLGFVWALKGDLTGAIREYQAGLELNAHSPPAYIGLAKALVEKGQLAEATALLKDALAPTRIPDSNKQKRAVQLQYNEYVSWARLDERLRPILISEERVNGPEEQVELGRMCLFYKHMYMNAGVFFAEAFGNRPELVGDLRNTNRFDAACAAALAGTGQGEDVAALQERDKQVWRERARHWLEEDLAQWSKLAASDNAADRALTRAAMFRWKQERYLAGIRNKDALLRLPEGERPVFQKLWDDVDVVLKRAGSIKGSS